MKSNKYKSHSHKISDESFFAGRVEFIVPGNQGRMLDARRTPIEVISRLHEIGAFKIRILDFEDVGAFWEIPYEDIGSYQFERNSKLASTAECIEIVRSILHHNHTLITPKATLQFQATNQRIDNERIACQNLLKKNRISSTDIESSIVNGKGSLTLFTLLEQYLEAKEVADLEQELSATLVSNPWSGELVKAYGLMLAELGLASFEGKQIRNQQLFSGRYTKARIANHIICRIAFCRELWRLYPAQNVVLFRGMSSESSPIRLAKSFTSMSFSESLARAHYEGSELSTYGLLERCSTNTDRIFMSFIETRAMNEKFIEQEALLFG